MLLRKCLNDSDDEVRERAFFYLSLLGDEQTIEQASDGGQSSMADDAAEELSDLRNFIFDSDQVINVDALEQLVQE